MADAFLFLGASIGKGYDEAQSAPDLESKSLLEGPL